MFNLSGSELVFLVLIALVVLGPDKLPEAMRKAGKAYADFKKMTSGFQSEMRSALDEPMRELRETAELAKKAANWDTNMFDPRGADTSTAPTKPVSASMAAQTPPDQTPPAQTPAAQTPAEPVVETTTTGNDAVPAADHASGVDATTRRLQAQSAAVTESAPQSAAATKPFSPNFSSAAPRVTPPPADTDEVAAE